MGKYATYRLRGGGQSLVPPIGPPPAPTIVVSAGELFSVEAAVDNYGGTGDLYFSNDGVSPYGFLVSEEWAPTILWGGTGDFSDGFYKSLTVGNGTNYLGESELSNFVIVTND